MSGPWQFKPDLKPIVPILQQQIQSDLLEPGTHISPGLSISEKDGFSPIDVKPLIIKQNGNSVRQVSPLESALGTLSGSNLDGLGCVFDVPLNVKNQNGNENKIFKEKHSLEGPAFSLTKFDENLELKNQNQSSTHQASIVGHSSVNGLETGSRKSVTGPESAFGFLGEDLMCRWFQGGDDSSEDFGIDNVGFSDSNFTENIDELSFPPFVPKFGLEYEYPYDWVEYPVIDQGLLFS